MKKVGVLSLQGDFAAHGAALERAGTVPVYTRERAQLGDIDGLILPGGESTTMLKLLRQEDLFDDLAEFGRRKPLFGTCAGAILMARDVTQFWTYDKTAFLKNPVYSRDYPPAKNLEQ